MRRSILSCTTALTKLGFKRTRSRRRRTTVGVQMSRQPQIERLEERAMLSVSGPITPTPSNHGAGDFNSSLVVDASDYVLWRKNAASTITHPEVGNNDPVVD